MPGPQLRVRHVALVLVAFAITALYNAYIHPAGVPGPAEVWTGLWFCLIGAVLFGVLWVGWRWAMTVRSLPWAQRLMTTMLVSGLLLALASALTHRADCSSFAIDAKSWRRPEFAIRSHPGLLGFEVPALELGAASDAFCSELLSLPALLGGIVLIAGGGLLHRRAADTHP